MAKLIAVIILTVFYFLYSGINHAFAQTATAYPTFGPTCAVTVGPGTPTCAATSVPTATRVPTTPPGPTATLAPPTPTQPTSGNLGITLAILGVAAFFIITGLTTLFSSAKSS